MHRRRTEGICGICGRGESLRERRYEILSRLLSAMDDESEFCMNCGAVYRDVPVACSWTDPL